MTLPGAGQQLAFHRVHVKISETAHQVAHPSALAGLRVSRDRGDQFIVVLPFMANRGWFARTHDCGGGTNSRRVFMDRHASVVVAFRRKAISGIYSCNGSSPSESPESSHALG